MICQWNRDFWGNRGGGGALLSPICSKLRYVLNIIIVAPTGGGRSDPLQQSNVYNVVPPTVHHIIFFQESTRIYLPGVTNTRYTELVSYIPPSAAAELGAAVRRAGLETSSRTFPSVVVEGENIGITV